MPRKSTPPASRAADRRVLLYFPNPATREQLDALAVAAGLTRSAMVARLVDAAVKGR